MRLFVALDLPPAVRGRLRRLIGSLRDELPDARWMRAEGVHLTLVFLGERPAEDVALLGEALEPVFARHAPFAVHVGGAGAFPRRSEARILWLGLDGGRDLEELQREVAETACAALEVEPEKRPFRPHLTLARCRRPWRSRAVRRFEEKALLETGFEVAYGSLFSSTLSPGGAVYEELARFPLRGERQAMPLRAEEV